MLVILLYFFIILLFIFKLNACFNELLHKEKSALEQKKKEIFNLENVLEQTKKENERLQLTLEQTLEIFDLTKKICGSLDPQIVFSFFKEQLLKKTSVAECIFLTQKDDLSRLKQDYEVLAVRIDSEEAGFLLVKKIPPKEEERFFVLSRQFMLGIKRAMLYQRVQELAITDALTNTFSRRHYIFRSVQELERSQRFGYSLSFLMIDIDHFKEINDRFGHLVGDVVLVEVAKSIKENIRQIDVLSRFGGEEFCLFLAETDKDGAFFAAERIRQTIESKKIQAYDEKLNVTISIGISSFPEDSNALDDLLDKADLALYRAKQQGRNRVCIYKST